MAHLLNANKMETITPHPAEKALQPSPRDVRLEVTEVLALGIVGVCQRHDWPPGAASHSKRKQLPEFFRKPLTIARDRGLHLVG
jgi:hypothetical protein